MWISGDQFELHGDIRLLQVGEKSTWESPTHKYIFPVNNKGCDRGKY